MKLDWMRADIASARRASVPARLLLACSMLANVTLAAFAMHYGRPRARGGGAAQHQQEDFGSSPSA